MPSRVEASITYLLNHWEVLAQPAAIVVAITAAGYLVKRLAFRQLENWSKRSGWRPDELVVAAVRGPFLLWVLMFALQVGVQSSELPERVTDAISKVLNVLLIVSVTMAVSRLAASAVKNFGSNSGSALPVNSLTQNVARIAVIIAGILALLQYFGVTITPALTALGVGGIALALALQQTLSNFFAGFYMSLAGQIRIGDFLRLENGLEGYVSDINWRTTTLRTLPNNVVLIPNAKLSESIVTNFHLPDSKMAAPIAIPVPYSCDPDLVTRVLLEIAHEATGRIEGLLSDPEPLVRWQPAFSDFAANVSLIVHVREFSDQFLVLSEIRKTIIKRFQQEGIEIATQPRLAAGRPETPLPGER